MADPTLSDEFFGKLWKRYRSEINIEVTHCLTEPVCPSAVTVIEHPRKVLTDTHTFGDTIDEAVHGSFALFIKNYCDDL